MPPRCAARLARLMLLAWIAIAPHVAGAQTAPTVTHLADPHAARFMWVGNSFFYYNNGMPDIVQHLMTGMPPDEIRPYSATLIAISGSGFSWHDLRSYFWLDGVGSRRNLAAQHLDKLWDATVMMDCSSCPIDPKSSKMFNEFARENSEVTRKHGAEPVFFMSWAYSDKPEMTGPLAEAYTLAGNANNALVIPAGLAFARVAEERPDLQLHQSDHRHPTLAGSYLAGATVYAALFGRSPEASSYTADLEPETARYLREAAWRTAQAYYNNRLKF